MDIKTANERMAKACNITEGKEFVESKGKTIAEAEIATILKICESEHCGNEIKTSKRNGSKLDANDRFYMGSD